jgi:hypothetical protein
MIELGFPLRLSSIGVLGYQSSGNDAHPLVFCLALEPKQAVPQTINFRSFSETAGSPLAQGVNVSSDILSKALD